MLVFFRRIPANTRHHDIKDFIKPALKSKLLNPFTRQGEILDIKFMVMKDNDLNALEHHSIVNIEPDSAALRVIKKLNRKPLKGKPINVRQYFYRSWHNDPRKETTDGKEDLIQRRNGNRRRRNVEVIEENTGKFSSSKKFHRRY